MHDLPSPKLGEAVCKQSMFNPACLGSIPWELTHKLLSDCASPTHEQPRSTRILLVCVRYAIRAKKRGQIVQSCKYKPDRLDPASRATIIKGPLYQKHL